MFFTFKKDKVVLADEIVHYLFFNTNINGNLLASIEYKQREKD